MSTQNHVQTGRFYTAARKFQQLIGVTPAGETIPGGPYTVTQFIVGIVVLVLGFISRPLWSQGALTDVLFIAAAVVGITYAVGRMPGSRRSIINLINCWITLMSRPRTGTYRGRKLPASYSKTKTKRSAARTTLAVADNTVEDSREEPTDVPTPQHGPSTSGLDRLNAHLTTAHENR
ncbi:hypothetical protein IWX65_002713 [Arthrobacter sp. CAN_A214]|uniref:hypothetical protein n=1 Tax=Arthrobacter sp. CAN_A214 TaxID=2787720 RepID=UPI0018CA7458